MVTNDIPAVKYVVSANRCYGKLKIFTNKKIKLNITEILLKKIKKCSHTNQLTIYLITLRKN